MTVVTESAVATQAGLKSRRRRPADRRDGGIWLPGPALAGSPRRRPDHPAHPAAACHPARDRRPADLEGGRGCHIRQRPTGQSPRTTSASSSTASCDRWGCSSARRQPAGGEEAGTAVGTQVRTASPTRNGPAGSTDPFRSCSTLWFVGTGAWPRSAVVCWWVFFRQGLAAAAYEAFEHPAAAPGLRGHHPFRGLPRVRPRRGGADTGGATPGVMGAGLYLVWPAFYTDVTDSYRLGRGGRVRTDLGGLYFNALVAVGIIGVWVTGYDALLLVWRPRSCRCCASSTPCPVRRLPRAGRPHRRAGPLPPHQADAAGHAAVAVARPRAGGSSAGPASSYHLGDRRRPAAPRPVVMRSLHCPGSSAPRGPDSTSSRTSWPPHGPTATWCRPSPGCWR